MGMPCEGAHFELTIDGTPRSHRDDPQIALEAARYLKACNPKGIVALRDIRTNVSTPVELDVLTKDRPTSGTPLSRGAGFCIVPSIAGSFGRDFG
jgi:hypothetical protein